MYDLSSRSFAADPYPTYTHLLRDAPVFRAPEGGMWYVSRHADIGVLLRHAAVSADYSDRLTSRLEEDARREMTLLRRVFSKMTLFRDPPAQARLRLAITRALSAEVAGSIGFYIAQRADQLLDLAGPPERMDVVAELAHPLPAAIAAELLGAPARDLPLFRQWAQEIAHFIGTYTDAAETRRAQAMLSGATEYFRERLRRPAPVDPAHPWRGVLLHELRAALKGNDMLTEDDLVACCVMLVFAGHETTTSLIGSALLCLLRHPDQMQSVQEDLRLLASVLDETLRYESPIQRTGRVAVEDVALDGGVVPAGAPLVLLLGAANRDPRVFENPDVFDIRRSGRAHMAFGASGHRCPGAALGMLQARVAIEAMLRRYRRIELAESPEWEYNLTLRRVRSLSVAVEGRPVCNTGLHC